MDDLTSKFTKVVVENEELKEAQKDLKYKIKSLKSKNKQLVSENERLRDEVEAMKSRRTNHNHDHVQSSLLKASNDYKALSAKYERLKALNARNLSTGNSLNGVTRNGGRHTPQSPITPGHHPTTRPTPKSAPVNPFESNPFDSNPFGDAAGDDDFWGDGNDGNNGTNNNNNNNTNNSNGNKTGDDFFDSMFN